MIQQQITIINKLGLHARAASKLVNLASQFSCSVFLNSQGTQINAKSIMGVMMLAASKGTEMTIEVDGEDEKNCMQALVTLINNRFDEPE